MKIHRSTPWRSAPSTVRARRLAVLLAMCFAAALSPSAASAASLHSVAPFSPITGAGIGTSFALPVSSAADESSGNIFVLSGAFSGKTDNLVDILGGEGGTPSGVASPFRIAGFTVGTEHRLRLAVDNSATSPNRGMLYVPDEGTVKKYVRNAVSEQYEQVGELIAGSPGAEVYGVALSEQGNVFISAHNSAELPGPGEGPSGPSPRYGYVTEFSPAGVEMAQLNMTESDEVPGDVAVDEAGDLFVQGTNRFSVFKYPVNALGEVEASNSVQVPTSGQVSSISMDRSSNTLFAATNTEISEFDATTLTEVGTFLVPDNREGDGGITVNHAAGWIYVANPFGKKAITALTLGGPTLPDVGTSSPAPLSATKATLNGTVNARGLPITKCEFVVNPNAESFPCEGTIPVDSSPHSVTAQLSGLAPGGFYSYDLVVTNANGTNKSARRGFQSKGIVETAAATGVTPGEATLNGIVRPEGSPLTECVFEYGRTKEYGSSVPCSPDSGSVPADFEPHAVSADLEGLLVGTTYHYRLRASGGLGSEIGRDFSFSTLGPSVEGISVPLLTDTTATLEATMNPHGKATTYHFEYGSEGPCASNPCMSVPVPDAVAGDGSSDVEVSQLVKDLSPNTPYHFRVVVSNSEGTGYSDESTFTTYDVSPVFGPCPNDAFRVGEPAAKLPDCRAYEQATPVDKNGNGITGQAWEVQASLSGDAITSLSKGGLPGGEGEETYPAYVSSRSAAGWSTKGLLPPPTFGDNASIEAWTPDLDSFLLIASQTGSSGPGSKTAKALLVRSRTTNSIQQITPYLHGASYAFAGGSADDSRLFFETAGSGINLTGNAATGKNNLYVFEPASEELSLVGVLPNGTAPPGGSFAGPFNWTLDIRNNNADGNPLATGGAQGKTEEQIPGQSGYLTQRMHAISADGSKAFFTAGLTGQIYMREGIGGEEPETVQVSASQRTTTDPDGVRPAIFMGATPSGSEAFFTSCEKLTDDSTAHSTSGNDCLLPGQGQDLYAYDTENHQLRDLTVDPGDPLGADVQGLIGTSDDGSVVYFVANGDLDGSSGPAQPGDCQYEESRGADYNGDCSLYVWHGGAIDFIARLHLHPGVALSDSTDWEPGAGATQGPTVPTGSVSADGQTVIFRSNQQLTGYDNVHPSKNSAGHLAEDCLRAGGPVCPQFFRYHLGDPGVSCLTCNPTGLPPALGAPTVQSIDPGLSTFWVPNSVRFASASGNQFFFETPEKLVAADVNGDDGCPTKEFPTKVTATCQDVYEWEASGAGSCNEASPAYSPPNGGCLYLLSSGTSSDPSFFGDASSSGNDAFIFTGDRLVPGDEDGLFDAYDVKVGGGLASQNQPPPPVPCEGSACRQGIVAPPSGQSAGSASFSGPPNPTVNRHKKHKKHKKHRKHRKEGHKRQAKRVGANRGGGK